MTVREILVGNLEYSLTIGIAIGSLSFIGMAFKKYLNKRRYGPNYDSTNPLKPKLVSCLKMALAVTAVMFIASLFETADCILAIYKDRPNAESYCQPTERNGSW